MLLIALGISALVNLSRRQAALDQMNARLRDIPAGPETAKASADRTTYAKSWLGSNPRYLACLRDLDAALRPERSDGRDTDIFLTGLVLREGATLKGTLTGKAADDKAVSDLPSRMLATKRFVDPKMTSLCAPKTTSGRGGGTAGSPGGRGSRAAGSAAGPGPATTASGPR